MQQLLKEYLQLHGYWVLFIGTFLEGEAVLIFAGLLACQGYLSIFGVILSAFAGSFLGDQFYFHLGRKNGPFLLRVFTRLSRKFRKALKLIERYGSFVAFISRYTYGFRILLPIVLGMTDFPARRFLWFNAISASTWAAVFALAGFLFGKGAALIVDDLEQYEPYMFLVLAGLIGLMWLSHFLAHYMHRNKARKRLRRMRARKSQSADERR
ncbi:DedA family protein [Geomesophilobacter sediminis]|uniref:DedA family protein n=1 Tax=Geomesophilobacter sediminis TaxID=2798584 RepID=A0A8J7M1K6_9BACT|nr:DedA family protein [Geomesophilobacter sediminis]MBJ6726789.1 DedA family protein [Geomesophilobacter sediminis]